MSTIFKPLADMDFGMILTEAHAETTSGENLLNKYRSIMLKNESNCTLVNNFINEAKNYLYDNGVRFAVNQTEKVIGENRISWRLASVCEAINANTSSYNFLNRNAAKQVEKLLEQNEENVVKYIKAGALKNVMYCESFRSIVKSVFNDKQTVIEENYKVTYPVSFTEVNEGKRYFEVFGNIYSVDKEGIYEAKSSEVTGTFLSVSRILESAMTTFDANNETLTIDMPNAVYTIFNEGEYTKCKREGKKNNDKCESITFSNTKDLRSHNNLVVDATVFSKRNAMAETLEGIAKCMECFNNFALLDNVKIVSTNNDKFVIIENQENIYSYSVASNHTSAWKVNTNVSEALEFIKKRTSIDLQESYKQNIEAHIETVEAENEQTLKEAIERDAIIARKNKIAMLTEKFKNDPARLAVLSKVAEEISEM